MSTAPSRASLFGRLRALPTVVWGLGAVSLFTDVASDMIVPLLPALLTSVGGGAVAIGLMEGVAELTSAALKIGTGSLVDRGVRPGPLIVGGYGVAALTRPLFALIGAPWQAVVLRSIDRVGKGVRSAPRDGMLADAVAKEDRGLAFGLHRGMDNLGAVLGALTSFLLLGVFGLGVKQVLIASLVPGVLSTLVAALVTRKERAKEVAPAGPSKKASPSAPLPSEPKRFLFIVAIFSLSASTDSFLLTHLLRQGLAVKWLPIAWICLQLVKAVLNVPGGAIADRIGARRAIVLGWAVYAMTYGLFAVSPNATATWLLFALYGVYYGLSEGAEKAYIAATCPKLAQGRAFGLLAAITGAALLPANLLFALLYERHAVWAFGAAAGLALLAAILLAAIVRDAPEAKVDQGASAA